MLPASITFSVSNTPTHVFPLSSLLPHTGQLGGLEATDGPSEDIQTSLEVGLLGHVRKVLMLMPDSLAHLVVGDVVKHFSLVAMAHNEDILVRTAAIRVSAPSSLIVCQPVKQADHFMYMP